MPAAWRQRAGDLGEHAPAVARPWADCVERAGAQPRAARPVGPTIAVAGQKPLVPFDLQRYEKDARLLPL